jgi:hypothetical protein
MEGKIMCANCKQINKSEVYGKMQVVTKNSGGIIKFSMLIHAQEAELIKHDYKVLQNIKQNGFEKPPCSLLFWSRELLLLTGEMEAGARLNLIEMINLVIEKLASNALNGIFKHARTKSGG